MSIPKHWAWAVLPLLALAVGLIVATNFGNAYRGWAFLGAIVVLSGELAIIGWLVNNRPVGAFIDSRNRISLSKLQAGAWTVIVLAALATLAAYNILAQGAEAGVTDLDIAIPGELLLAMGISATSLVAAPALLHQKSQDDTTNEAVQQADKKVPFKVTQTSGKVLVRPPGDKASWADLVTGDEIGNAGTPDLGKIQQVLITVLLLACYIGYVFLLFASSQAPIHELPQLDPSFVWLLALSHAAYLSYKAAPHTPTAG